MERLRHISILVEVDTNKKTHYVRMEPDEDETIEQFVQRVREWIEERLP